MHRVLVVYKKDSGGTWKLLTMYPQHLIKSDNNGEIEIVFEQ
jgi:hypothetical protein